MIRRGPLINWGDLYRQIQSYQTTSTFYLGTPSQRTVPSSNVTFYLMSYLIPLVGVTLSFFSTWPIQITTLLSFTEG